MAKITFDVSTPGRMERHDAPEERMLGLATLAPYMEGFSIGCNFWYDFDIDIDISKCFLISPGTSSYISTDEHIPAGGLAIHRLAKPIR